MAASSCGKAPRIIGSGQCYECFYCRCTSGQLIQFGEEASSLEEVEWRDTLRGDDLKMKTPKIIRELTWRSCFYCGTSSPPLIQFGEEASSLEEIERGEPMISPEDSNAVELCLSCLEKALKQLRGEDL